MEYIEHITLDGDRWDQIATLYYGDASRISPLAEANEHLRLRRGKGDALHLGLRQRRRVRHGGQWCAVRRVALGQQRQQPTPGDAARPRGFGLRHRCMPNRPQQQQARHDGQCHQPLHRGRGGAEGKGVEPGQQHQGAGGELPEAEVGGGRAPRRIRKRGHSAGHGQEKWKSDIKGQMSF